MACLLSIHGTLVICVFSQREYELAVKDCEEALAICEESRRALYRKALCLKELGKYREAYECTTRYLLISRLVNTTGCSYAGIRAYSSKIRLKNVLRIFDPW